jgi:hypothetical protein
MRIGIDGHLHYGYWEVIPKRRFLGVLGDEGSVSSVRTLARRLLSLA